VKLRRRIDEHGATVHVRVAVASHAVFRRHRCCLRRPETNVNIFGFRAIEQLLVGLAAGWLAGQIIQGTGFGLVVDLLIGIVGAFIGGWLLPLLGIHLWAGLVRSVRERAYCFP
jgi:uncharacterized membrane protein YeaQ/YmgE (transglycosylase-associated protein family)